MAVYLKSEPSPSMSKKFATNRVTNRTKHMFFRSKSIDRDADTFISTRNTRRTSIPQRGNFRPYLPQNSCKFQAQQTHVYDPFKRSQDKHLYGIKVPQKDLRTLLADREWFLARRICTASNTKPTSMGLQDLSYTKYIHIEAGQIKLIRGIQHVSLKGP